MILLLYIKHIEILAHARACESSRGHISRFPFDWAVHQGAGKATEYTVSSFAYKYARIGALEIYDPFRCVQSVQVVHTLPLYRQWLI